MNPLEIRKRARKSRAWVAAHADVSEPTCKLYELVGPEAVSERPRAALTSAYERLAQTLPPVEARP